MEVSINGEPRQLPPGTTVAIVVSSLAEIPEGRGVAVALDGEVVPRGAWGETRVSDGSRIEVVAAVQGG